MGKPKIARRDTGARHNRKTRILLLETQLPARPSSSSRRQIVFMQELLRPFSNLELIGERVHSRSDLKKFLDLARRDPRIRHPLNANRPPCPPARGRECSLD